MLLVGKIVALDPASHPVGFQAPQGKHSSHRRDRTQSCHQSAGRLHRIRYPAGRSAGSDGRSRRDSRSLWRVTPGRTEATQRGIRIEQDFKSNLPRICGNQQQLKQGVLKLCLDAIYLTCPDGRSALAPMPKTFFWRMVAGSASPI